MNKPTHIYISFDAADLECAQDLGRQLMLALQPVEVEFWDKSVVPVEEFRTKANEFIERADLFVAVLSMNYLDSADVRWEMQLAVEQQTFRSGFQVMTVLARPAELPSDLRRFAMGLPPGEFVENANIGRDRQLNRAAKAAVSVLKAAPERQQYPEASLELPLTIHHLRDRLLAQTDRINHAPLIALLKRLIQDVQVKRALLDIEESFKQIREKTRLSQVSVDALAELTAPVQMDLYHLIQSLETDQLATNWRNIFIRDYYHFSSDSRDDSTVPPFFIPVDEIQIPETLNLPVGPREQESLEQIGLLSYEQKTEFRRRLLLAKDALAVKNSAQAFAHCDYVRQEIDPQSAQLYEYLLITYLQKETPARALSEALRGNDRVLQHILLFASRLKDYQQAKKCPSSSVQHNLAIVSESISDAALRLYYHFPNDPLLHTGKHRDDVPDNRRNLRIILENTLKVCRVVYPSEELLEAAVIESCGGGKCQWIKGVEVHNKHFQFVPDGNFDLLGEIQELLELLKSIESEEEGKIVKGQNLLREDLYFSLLAKRQTLDAQLKEDARRRRPFTDARESIVRFIYACLLGSHVFGNRDDAGNSFLRLALEYLMPGLLKAPESFETLGVRWFTLDAKGEVMAHPDCRKYSFDAMGIVEKIIRDHAGTAGWLQVQPNIKEVVYKQYLKDTEAIYESVVKGLAWTDFRKMDPLDARRLLIDCLRRWVVAYRANHEKGLDYLNHALQELTGNGILIWFQQSAKGMTAHPESIGLGYDPQQGLKEVYELMKPESKAVIPSEDDLSKKIALNIFDKQILPVYNAIRKGDENQRSLLIGLFQQCLGNYKLDPDTKYLDFIWDEIGQEKKLPWVDISLEGKAVSYKPVNGFNPLEVIQKIQKAIPDKYSQLIFREAIAEHRHTEQVNRYFNEISEFRHENRQPERKIAIEIIQKIKGIYHYFPKAEFLELAWDELYARPGKSRIRWNNLFLGLIPLNSDHYENQFFNFNYKFERYEIRRLLDNQYMEMQRVLAECAM